MTLAAPYCHIRRVFGRRSFPEDWPRFYDSWDAFDGDGNFLLTLHYKALAELLGGTRRLPHDVRLEFDNPEDGPLVITPATSFDLTITLRFDGFTIVNPETLVSRSELRRVMAEAAQALLSGTVRDLA